MEMIFCILALVHLLHDKTISGVVKSTVIFYCIFNVILSRLFLASEYCCELAAKIMHTCDLNHAHSLMTMQ